MLHMSHDFNTLEQLRLIAAAAAQNNHGAPVIIARSPNPITVVFADGLRQSIARAVIIHCRRLAPAVGKNSRAGALFRWKAVVDPRDLLHHLLPAKLVGIPLRQRPVLLMFELRRLQAKRFLIPKITFWRQYRHG